MQNLKFDGVTVLAVQLFNKIKRKKKKKKKKKTKNMKKPGCYVEMHLFLLNLFLFCMFLTLMSLEMK